MNVTRGELQWSWSRTYGLQGRIVQVKSAEAQCPTLTWCENWPSGQGHSSPVCHEFKSSAAEDPRRRGADAWAKHQTWLGGFAPETCQYPSMEN
ncbi:hypothetical protein TNCV_4979062 [Trichonephila clavipes]|nr:hypothetical protein TNCV_4979062 [Trichonephila clavipes]